MNIEQERKRFEKHFNVFPSFVVEYLGGRYVEREAGHGGGDITARGLNARFEGWMAAMNSPDPRSAECPECLVPEGWKIEKLSKSTIRVYEPDGSWFVTMDDEDGYLPSRLWRLASALFKSAPQPKQSKRLDKRDIAALGEIARELKSMGQHELADKASRILGRNIGSVIGASDPQPEQAVRRDGITLEARHWLEVADIIRSCGEDEDCLLTEWRVEDCDKRGVIGDDDIRRHYPAVMYEAEYPEEGVIPIGDEIKPENPEQNQS